MPMPSEDKEKSALLDIDELYVVQGSSDDYFNTWKYERTPECCPVCECRQLKVHNRFSKRYLDVIDTNKYVTLEYHFYKYRCLNPECGRVFSPDISFAGKTEKVTYRLEQHIADYIADGLTLSQVSTKLNDQLSRQAVGQIFNRFVHRKSESDLIRSKITDLAIISGDPESEFAYTLFIDLNNGINVFDVVLGVDSASITAILQKIGIANIKKVVTDCNSIIVNTVKDNLPGVTHIIPVQFWFKTILADFEVYAKDILKWCPVHKKMEVLLSAPDDLGFRRSNLEAVFDSRPKIKEPYEIVNRLRKTISDRQEIWVFQELQEWVNSLPLYLIEEFGPSIYQLNFYKDEISNHSGLDDPILRSLCSMTSMLEDDLKEYKQYSDEIIKARVLYTVPEDLTEPPHNGIKIENILKHLEQKEDEKYE